MAKESLNTYQSLAENDYLFLKASLSACAIIGNYNNVAILCQQVCEKYLKALIINVLQDDKEAAGYLSSHNLKALLGQTNKVDDLIKVKYRDIKYVSDFYYDAKYPGDNFTVVNEEMFRECLEITEEIRRQALNILGRYEKGQDKQVAEDMKVTQNELFK